MVRSRLTQKVARVENGIDATGNVRAKRRIVKQTWEEMFMELEDYMKEHGNCAPKTHENKLGRWVSTQRARYGRGELDDKQIQAMNSIGFEWKLVEWEGPAESWDDMFQNLLKYKEKHGNCNVPTLTTKLGRWVSTQRMRKEGTKSNAGPLSDDQILKLEGIGFQWRQKQQSGFQWWDEMYNELEEHYKKHGNCLVKVTEGKLGNWVSIQRQRRRKGDLSETQIEMLDGIDFEWDLGMTNYTWEESFQKLQEYHAEHGHCNVGTHGGFLGGWVCRQRMNRRKTRPGWKPLTKDQIVKLDNLGFNWDAQDHDGKWDEMYLQLVDYYEEHGHSRIPIRSGKLGKWAGVQRRCKHKKCGSNRQLTTEQIERLDAIEFVWKADENIESWETMYEKLKEYKEANGDCLVPQSAGKLGSWVDIQRQRRRKQIGRQKILTQEQVKLLDALGFVWSAEERFQELWEQKYRQLEAFSREHGHCQVPRRSNEGDPEMATLSRWVERMRGIHKGTLKGKTVLTEDQTQRLEALGCFRESKKQRRK